MSTVNNGLQVATPLSGDEVTGQPWRIYGTDCQIVEVALAPNESAMCEPGAMCYTSDQVTRLSLDRSNFYASWPIQHYHVIPSL